MNLNKQRWTNGLMTKRFEDHHVANEKLVENLANLSKAYHERVLEEEGKTLEEVEVMNVGKVDPKKRLENDVSDLMSTNIIQCLGAMLDTVVF